jgi:hypothetical protein
VDNLRTEKAPTLAQITKAAGAAIQANDMAKLRAAVQALAPGKPMPTAVKTNEQLGHMNKPLPQLTKQVGNDNDANVRMRSLAQEQQRNQSRGR